MVRIDDAIASPSLSYRYIYSRFSFVIGPIQAEGVEGDPYCVWTFTGCIGPDDLSTCPQGNWAMTYDDGPSAFSPKLYDYLDKVNQKVTFFMVGGQVLQYPELAQRAYKAGHEIAMHTWSHSYMTTLTDEQLVAELKWNEQVIKEAIGVSPKYFRPVSLRCHLFYNADIIFCRN